MPESPFSIPRRHFLSRLAVGGLAVQVQIPQRCSAQTETINAVQFRALKGLRDRHSVIRDQLVADLDKLASECEAKQLVGPAEQIRSLAGQAGPEKRLGGDLPRHVQEEIQATLPPDQRYWRMQLRHLRTEYARELYLLSRNALRANLPSYAFELIREVAHFDTDHEQAREILGYVRLRDEWMTPFEKRQLTSTQRFKWHDQFGWLPDSYIERYERGDRRFKTRWMSAEEEAVLRQDFRNAWQVRTENFLVKTNHSLERGVEIAKELESYRRFFRETFAAYFNTPAELQKVFSGRGRPLRPTKPHEVHYFRSQSEYNQTLKQVIPQIEVTNGLYYTRDRTSYFFATPDGIANYDTLYHEATHQFLYENSPINRDIAEEANFWIVEGLACYMESYRATPDTIGLGDPNHIRIEAARYRLLEDRYYIPLKPFTSMGLKEFQADLANIQKNYSQASGLAHFFMNYGDGQYRDALMMHLRQLYLPPRRGRPVQGLDELTGESFDELDRQYITYMKELEDALQVQSAS